MYTTAHARNLAVTLGWLGDGAATLDPSMRARYLDRIPEHARLRDLARAFDVPVPDRRT